MSADHHRGLFTAPAPVRRLFKLFPLQVYDAEALPQRSPKWTNSTLPSQKPHLYVFSSPNDARHGRPSYNPSCLKWQALFRLGCVDVDLVASSNHASPSGALPFLLPPPRTVAGAEKATLKASSGGRPLTGSALYKYALEHSSSLANLEDDNPRVELYRSLVTQNIRSAYLYALYLQPSQLPLLATLYLPTSPALRLPQLYALRTAAADEILNTIKLPHIVPSHLFRLADDAFEALSVLLGADACFFQGEGGLFDAEVFGYLWVILNLDWVEGGEFDKEGIQGLRAALERRPNLVSFVERFYERCWVARL